MPYDQRCQASSFQNAITIAGGRARRQLEDRRWQFLFFLTGIIFKRKMKKEIERANISEF